MNTEAKIVKENTRIMSGNATEKGKRILDIVFSLSVIFFVWPLMLVVAVFIKLSSRGPVLFKQERQGLNGHIFEIYKFRSMRQHEEKEGEVTQAKKNDSRITKVGRVLRRTSIDELPQFLNVIKGDMSVVGPRPHATEHNEFYAKKIKNYREREKVKPGITGLAQISGFRGETETLDKMQARVNMDLDYIDRQSIWLDIVIIIKTPLSLLKKDAY